MTGAYVSHQVQTYNQPAEEGSDGCNADRKRGRCRQIQSIKLWVHKHKKINKTKIESNLGKAVLREGEQRSRGFWEKQTEKGIQRESGERGGICQDSFHSFHPPSTCWSRNGGGCSPNHYTQLPSWKVFTVVNERAKRRWCAGKGKMALEGMLMTGCSSLCGPFKQHFYSFFGSFHFSSFWLYLFLRVRPAPSWPVFRQVRDLSL